MISHIVTAVLLVCTPTRDPQVGFCSTHDVNSIMTAQSLLSPEKARDACVDMATSWLKQHHSEYPGGLGQVSVMVLNCQQPVEHEGDEMETGKP